jgi:hypothetical protein
MSPRPMIAEIERIGRTATGEWTVFHSSSLQPIHFGRIG